MVHVRGGRTRQGNDTKDIAKLLEKKPTTKRFIRTLDGTTPQVSSTVAPFFIGLTEVTNEQYLEYVKASGARPPHYWAEEAINTARTEFLSSKDRKREDRFNPAFWWAQNWTEQEWSEPEGLDLLRPVTFVDLSDARNYASWIGLRLPTEAEFERAVRGDGEAQYPWGDEWVDGKFAATNEIRAANGVFPVGAFPLGANKQGVLDLSGNVWEWTVSRYVAYDGWKPGNKYTVGKGSSKEVLEPRSTWDPASFISKGGAFMNGSVAAMSTMRRATASDQELEALGFRTVASAIRGQDLAASTFNNALSNSQARAEGATFLTANPAIVDFWESRETACTPADVKKERKLKKYEIPSDYRVITSYQHLLFVPREELEQTSPVQLNRDSLAGAVQLGFMSLSQPIVEPALAEGVYLVAYRAKGKPVIEASAGEGDEDRGSTEAVGDPFEGQIDLQMANLLFLNATSGELAAHIPLREALTIKKGKGKSSFAQVEKRVPSKNEEGEPIMIAEQWIELKTEIPTKQRNRYLPLSIEMKPGPGFFDQKWRW